MGDEGVGDEEKQQPKDAVDLASDPAKALFAMWGQLLDKIANSMRAIAERMTASRDRHATHPGQHSSLPSPRC